MGLFGKRHNKDYAWYERRLAERLVEIQQLNQAFDNQHVVRDYGDEFARELSDAAIVEVLEHIQGAQGAWRLFRAKLKAELVRRREASDRLIKRVTIATLVLTIIGIIVDAKY